jgi:ribosome-binding ATPase YchF (GTP1/OBG family)
MGIVGLPNVGKSTLFNVLTKVRLVGAKADGGRAARRGA